MDQWTQKLDPYLDGELPATEMQALDAHLRSCSACAADVASRVQLKRAVQSAGKRYAPSAEFRQRVRSSIAARPRRSPLWIWATAAATVAVLCVVGLVTISARRQALARQQVFSEIADLHVAALASANPVDVISTDRHTVKPWFQGRIPFTFNLPELQNSDFSLLGGRVTYLGQTPGAELIYQIRKHQISVFIFQDRLPEYSLSSDSDLRRRQASFNVESWSQDGLRYFVIGDANGDDIRRLAEMLKKAAQS